MIYQAKIRVGNEIYEISVLSCNSENTSVSGDYLTSDKFFEIWKCFLKGSPTIEGIDKVSYIKKLNHMSVNRVFTVILDKQESGFRGIETKKDLLQIAIETNQLEIVSTLFDNFQINYNDTHIRSAKLNSRVHGGDMCRFLTGITDAGSTELNDNILSQLFKSAITQNWKTFENFLDQAPPDIKSFINNQPNGQSLLHLTTLLAPIDIVKQLVEKGADYRIKDEAGFTPLDIARHSNDNEKKAYFESLHSTFTEKIIEEFTDLGNSDKIEQPKNELPTKEPNTWQCFLYLQSMAATGVGRRR